MDCLYWGLLPKEESNSRSMGSGRIDVFSFSVNGLLNQIKSSKILRKIRKEKAHIVYLQETHLNYKEQEK